MYETETSQSFEYWKGIAREVNNAIHTDRYTPYDCAYIFDDLKKGGNTRLCQNSLNVGTCLWHVYPNRWFSGLGGVSK